MLGIDLVELVCGSVDSRDRGLLSCCAPTESLDEARCGLAFWEGCCCCWDSRLPAVRDDFCVFAGESCSRDVALWFESQRPFKLDEFAWLPFGVFIRVTEAVDEDLCCSSGVWLVRSRKLASYGLKLDFVCWMASVDELLDNDEDWLIGDDLSRDSALLLWCFVDFSMFASSFGLGGSAPIALHVCARRASGLFLASNCNEKKKEMG